jgi:hypothetical protein
MLPKSIFLSPLRIIKQVTDGKYMQNSPYRAQIKKHSSKRNLTPIKNYDRNALLIPVLNKSTVGHKSTLSVN